MSQPEEARLFSDLTEHAGKQMGNVMQRTMELWKAEVGDDILNRTGSSFAAVAIYCLLHGMTNVGGRDYPKVRKRIIAKLASLADAADEIDKMRSERPKNKRKTAT